MSDLYNTCAYIQSIACFLYHESILIKELSIGLSVCHPKQALVICSSIIRGKLLSKIKTFFGHNSTLTVIINYYTL